MGEAASVEGNRQAVQHVETHLQTQDRLRRRVQTHNVVSPLPSIGAA